MKAYAKKADTTLANLQDTIMKALSGMSSCIHELLQCRETKTIPNYQNIIPQLLDTTALLGHVCRELSFKRKEAIRPMLHPDFKPLYSKNHKVGLFGEDLTKTVMSLIHQTGQNNFNKCYHAHGPSQPSKPFFLSQRGRPQFPPRKAQHYQQQKTSTKHLFRNIEKSG
jgi:hypothetical protein